MSTSWRLRGDASPARRHARGVTLVELVVCLAVIGVLAAGALQFSPPIVTNIRLTSASNGFLAHLALVRSEAIKRNASAALCKSADGEHCALTGGWEQGWIAFHDANDNGLHEAGEAVILRAQPLARGLRFSGNGTMARYVSFGASGRTQATNGAFQAGTLTVCQVSTQTNEARQIVINATGRARVRRAVLPRCD